MLLRKLLIAGVALSMSSAFAADFEGGVPNATATAKSQASVKVTGALHAASLPTSAGCSYSGMNSKGEHEFEIVLHEMLTGIPLPSMAFDSDADSDMLTLIGGSCTTQVTQVK